MTPSTPDLPQLIASRIRKLKTRLQAGLWAAQTPLAVSAGPILGEFLSLADARKLSYKPLREGAVFGGPGDTWKQRWLKLSLPAAKAGEKGKRHLCWDCQGEATVYVDGVAWAGLDPAHLSCPLPDKAATLWISLGLWQTAIVGPETRPIDALGLRFTSAKLGIRDESRWKAYWDLEILCQRLGQLFREEGIEDPWSGGYQKPLEHVSPMLRPLLRRLEVACDDFELKGLGALQKNLQKIYADFTAEDWQPGAALCGHAHIDLVWLWPETVTAQKAVHTFATQLRLMERYPEFIFSQSQPAEYRMVEAIAPGVMKQVRRRLREGRWEAMGALEVELDNQMPCGEALARALAYGQRGFVELSGKRSEVCWLPDVFGYSACLPQVLALGGVSSFFTTKMHWSMVTKFPHTSFVWRSPDGSEVLSHLCSTGYIGLADVKPMVHALAAHRQSDLHPELLLPMGYGDGGGGVTEGILEKARRLKDLGGLPRAAWTRVDDFFKRMQRTRQRLPRFEGELYLEFHQGTFTTQSEYKRLHRGLERALQAHDAVRALQRGKPLGMEDWQRLSFSEFHDALPGSSIALVYDQLQPELAGLAQKHLAAASQELAGSGPGLIAFNPLGFSRKAIVEVPPRAGHTACFDGHGRELLTQVSGKGKEAKLLVKADLPALGSLALRSGKGGAKSSSSYAIQATPKLLDNGRLRASFDADGQLSALSLDGQALELAAPCGFRTYMDVPADYEAWNIDPSHLKLGRPAAERLRLKVVEAGPLRARLRGVAALGQRSRLQVDYVLEAESPWLKVELSVDWKEKATLLKFHAPTKYQGPSARFGGPFGSLLRRQVPGLDSDEAKWEVPGSRWAAVIREDESGLAIVTEAKYGFSCREGNLGLSLLRGTIDPDPNADQGQHHIRFALGAHRAGFKGHEGGTAAAAESLYAPFVLAPGAKAVAPPFAFEGLGSLVPSWVLPSEDGKGMVIRLHETSGRAGHCTLKLAKAGRLQRVDFLEEALAGSKPSRPALEYRLDYQPYQILSLKLT